MRLKFTFLFMLLFVITQLINAQPVLTYKELASNAVYKGDKQLIDSTSLIPNDLFQAQSIGLASTGTLLSGGGIRLRAIADQQYTLKAIPTSVIQFNPTGNYTIEFKARIHSGTGRGLDLSVWDGVGKNSSGLNMAYNKFASTDGTNYLTFTQNYVVHTVRLAVERALKKTHIYIDGVFVATRDMDTAISTDDVYFRFGKSQNAGIQEIDVSYIAIDQTGAYTPVAPTTTPVTLTKFNAVKDNSGVKLVWETTSEYNNSHFIVERSNDGISYISIGSLLAKGPSVYSLIDNSPIVGDNYYRLTQYDLNGEKESFPVQRYSFSLNNNNLSVYPNPITNLEELSISNISNGNIKISIYDILGKKVLEEEKNITNGVFKTKIRALKSGVYHLEIADNNRKVSSKLLVK